MKFLKLTLAALAAVLLVAACGHPEYYQAMATIAKERATEVVADKEAEKKRYEALNTALTGATPEVRAAAVGLLAIPDILKAAGIGGAGQRAELKLERPRDFLDYVHGFTPLIGAGLNTWGTIASINANKAVALGAQDASVRLEEVRTAGTTNIFNRFGQSADVAVTAAANPALRAITITGNGNGVAVDGSSVSAVTKGPNADNSGTIVQGTANRVGSPDTVNCTSNAGDAAPGGNGGNTTGGAGGNGAPGGAVGALDCSKKQ